MATLVDERMLDERLARLEAARPWSPRVVSRLEALIRTSDDAALFRINPLTFASERGLDEGEAIDLFLHATAQALFEMDWLLICPRCACAVESFARLRAVLRRFRAGRENNGGGEGRPLRPKAPIYEPAPQAAGSSPLSPSASARASATIAS